MKFHENRLTNILMVLVLILTPVFNIYSNELIDCDMDTMSQPETMSATTDSKVNSPCHEESKSMALLVADTSTCCCDDNSCGCMTTVSSFIQISDYSLNVQSDLSKLLDQYTCNILTTFIPSLHKPPIA